ncbi:MAG: hypothetical protein HGA87_05535 [Desulfobulbaceae bacterium]|nr:hypothetical protein [Desulfobulbaceae bacterium]
MGGERKASQGRDARLKNNCADRADDRAEKHYNLPSPESKAFDVDSHIRAIRRAMVDAVYLLKDWPTRARFSWYVDRNGSLRCMAERR